MKTTPLFSLGLVLCSFTLASAEPPAATPGKSDDRPISAAALKKYDKDGDGKLSDDEKAVMIADRKAKAEKREKEMLAKYDADKDGSLSDTEKATMREQRKKEMIAKFDKDGDGKVSPEEREAGKAARGEHKD